MTPVSFKPIGGPTMFIIGTHTPSTERFKNWIYFEFTIVIDLVAVLKHVSKP